MGLKNRSLVSALDLKKREILDIFDLADEIKKGRRLEIGRTVALLFFEPSTRTYYSFNTAAALIGCRVIGFQNPSRTSTKKGESLQDTARMFVGYGADLIVIRHSRAGAPLYLSQVLDVPVVNAGDDSREHPTQALLDVYTIRERFGDLDGLKVGIMGDLRYGRTPSSLAYLLSNWKVHIDFIAPDLLQIDKRNDSLEERLKRLGVKYRKREELDADIDVLYVTRVQRERFPDEAEYERVRNSYRLDPSVLPRDSIVLHPLPRVDEIPPSFDSDPRAWYFRQAENGRYVRAALMAGILGWSDGQ